MQDGVVAFFNGLLEKRCSLLCEGPFLHGRDSVVVTDKAPRTDRANS